MVKSIALICDDKYVMPTIITIQSIKDACKSERNIHIYICTFGISEVNERKFCQLSDSSVTVSVKRVNIEKYHEYLSKINQKSHVTPTSLLKFELPVIFKDIDVLLYLDSDIIIKENIMSIFEYDISNYYLAAAPELWKYINVFHTQESIKNDFYFNSGVLLLNLKKMREHDIPNKLWKKKIELSQTGKFSTMDQDTLNQVCSKNSFCLPIIWNFNTYFSDSNNNKLNLINKILTTHYPSHTDLVSSVKILHYVGKEDKPWVYYTANCIEYWDNAYKNAGYKIEELRRIGFQKSIKWYLQTFFDMIQKKGIFSSVAFIWKRTQVK